MSGPGVLGARGQWKQSAADRTDLLNGSLVIALYTEQQPNGAVRIIIPPYR
jgi:hypothetical protein